MNLLFLRLWLLTISLGQTLWGNWQSLLNPGEEWYPKPPGKTWWAWIGSFHGFKSMCVCVCVLRCFSCVWVFETLWTVTRQAPLSMGFSRQEYWSEAPFPSPGNLPDPRVKPRSPQFQEDSLPSEPPGKPMIQRRVFDTRQQFSIFFKQQSITVRVEPLISLASYLSSPVVIWYRSLSSFSL